MGSLLKGLAAIKANQEEQAARAAERERPKGEWFKWPNKTTTTATVRFLQELDEGATNYNPDRGLGIIAVEHQAPGPEGYKRRGMCTGDTEGQCYACERHSANYQEGWRQRQNLYINALVQFEGSDEKKVVILTRNANSTFAHALVEEAVDEGSITDANFKITKVGQDTGTQWLLKRQKGDPFDDSDVEVFNLEETAIRNVPYEKQSQYYGAVYSDGTGSNEGDNSSSAAAPSSDDEW